MRVSKLRFVVTHVDVSGLEDVEEVFSSDQHVDFSRFEEFWIGELDALRKLPVADFNPCTGNSTCYLWCNQALDVGVVMSVG